eukprot:jgi/Mesen1/3556/ME000199S02713
MEFQNALLDFLGRRSLIDNPEIEEINGRASSSSTSTGARTCEHIPNCLPGNESAQSGNFLDLESLPQMSLFSGPAQRQAGRRFSHRFKSAALPASELEALSNTNTRVIETKSGSSTNVVKAKPGLSTGVIDSQLQSRRAFDLPVSVPDQRPGFRHAPPGIGSASSANPKTLGPGGGASKRTSAGSNAVAGGLAGAFVSICLHPIDTVKTLVQVDRGRGRQLAHVVKTLMTEKGVRGFYGGIGSNLATAAPISAIYASTYEAVKEALLPQLPPARARASPLYTPSEAVKQRMQLAISPSSYASSWSALVGMARAEGGLAGLYAGLPAVLCRNFYTYETLKGWALKGRPGGSPLSPLTQLAIGGLAGSTAAFVTTPLDVVKTRLQTQLPGVVQYKGVRDAMAVIVRQEGVAGLYRGLVPRLVIYVSQGAVFFASYELLKRLLAEAGTQRNDQTITFTENNGRASGTVEVVAKSTMLSRHPVSKWCQL